MNSFPSGSSLEIVRGRHFHGGAVFDPNQGTRETRARVSFLLAALLSLRFLSPPAAAESATAKPHPVTDASGLHVTIDGKAYPKSGPKWVGGSGTQRCPMSPDGKYVAVFSYSGNAESAEFHDFRWRWRDPVRGEYFVDIYDRATGRLGISMRGSFVNQTPGGILQESFWLQQQYYAVPLSLEGVKRILLCNVAAADGGRH